MLPENIEGDQEAFDAFWYWINERHQIYLRKQADPKGWPWTSDPILQEYRFCNVFRELDTVTMAFRKMIVSVLLGSADQSPAHRGENDRAFLIA